MKKKLYQTPKTVAVELMGKQNILLDVSSQVINGTNTTDYVKPW